MEIEQLEIHDFLQSSHPLNKLTTEELNDLTAVIEISYSPRGKTILEPNQHNQWLYLIRSGAVKKVDHQDGLVAQFSSQDFFGHKAIERGGLIKNKVFAIEDALFYMIPDSMYQQLMKSNQAFNNYFSQHKNQRLKSALNELKTGQENSLIKTRVVDFLHHQPLTISSDTSIKVTAQLMHKTNQTAALITTEKQVIGIVTDRVFCTQVVTNDLDTQQPISSIMTTDVVSIDPQQTGLEAMLQMTRLNIRHLPVIQDNKLLGLLTATDLIHHQSHNPIYMVNQIHKADKQEQLVQLSKQLPIALVKMVDANLNANDIAYSISSIGRAIIQKIIQLNIDKLGPAPIPFAYLIAGSLARNDQTAHSDQDNGLLLSDEYNEQQHGPYFSQLANQVSTDLDQCGYIYCPGNVMASNDKWRQPMKKWLAYFNQWVNTPEPMALMYSSIFFDLRCVYGDFDLFKELQQTVKDMIKNNRIFLAYLAANAQQNKPPLGLFRRFVLEKNGAESKALDMKKRGIMPCTDIARVFALDAGTEVINTRDRFRNAEAAHIISNEAAEDLIDSYEFLSIVRLQHQVNNIKEGKEADNYVNPNELSSLERRHLKDAFELVSTYQEVLSKKYNQGQM